MDVSKASNREANLRLRIPLEVPVFIADPFKLLSIHINLSPGTSTGAADPRLAGSACVRACVRANNVLKCEVFSTANEAVMQR